MADKLTVPPCLHCGGDCEVKRIWPDSFVVCNVCGATGAKATTPELAIWAWGTHKTEDYKYLVDNGLMKHITVFLVTTRDKEAMGGE